MFGRGLEDVDTQERREFVQFIVTFIRLEQLTVEVEITKLRLSKEKR